MLERKPLRPLRRSKLRQGDCLEVMKDIESGSVDLIVTSPPYNKKGLMGGRSRGNQIWKKFNIDYSEYGDDMFEDAYIVWQIKVLDEMFRVLKDDGSIFYNHKPRRHKNEAHLPFEIIDKTKAVLYQLIIWNRRNSPNIRNDIFIPSTEHIYWLRKKKPKTYRSNVDSDFIGEVWTIPASKQDNHPAPFPLQIVENAIKMTTNSSDCVVLDPFMGSGTTGVACKKLHRNFIGIELDKNYFNIAKDRIKRASFRRTRGLIAGYKM